MARRTSGRAHRVKLALDTNAYKALGEGNQQLAEEVRTAEVVGLPTIVRPATKAFNTSSGSR